MIIDNSNSTTATPVNDAAAKDPSLNNTQSILVTNVADADTQIVAANIADIKNVSANISAILSKTEAFNINYAKLMAEVDNGTRTGLSVLNQSLDTFTAEIIADIDSVAAMTAELKNINNIKDVIVSVNGMQTLMDKINNNMQVITAVATSTEQISAVNKLSQSIHDVLMIQTELLNIDANMNKIQTIYNYMSELLLVCEWANSYKQQQAALGFTDEQFYNAMITLMNNLTALLEIFNNLGKLTNIYDLIQMMPDKIAETEAQLLALFTKYQLALADQQKTITRELNSIVADTKIQFAEILLKFGNIDQSTNEAIAKYVIAGTGIIINQTATNQYEVSLNLNYINSLIDDKQLDFEKWAEQTRAEVTAQVAANKTLVENYIAEQKALLTESLATQKLEFNNEITNNKLVVANTKQELSDLLLRIEYYVRHLHEQSQNNTTQITGKLGNIEAGKNITVTTRTDTVTKDDGTTEDQVTTIVNTYEFISANELLTLSTDTTLGTITLTVDKTALRTWAETILNAYDFNNNVNFKTNVENIVNAMNIDNGTKYVAGTNITFANNLDGTVSINAAVAAANDIIISAVPADLAALAQTTYA